jgi:hypothetical protein
LIQIKSIRLTSTGIFNISPASPGIEPLNEHSIFGWALPWARMKARSLRGPSAAELIHLNSRHRLVL